MKKGVKSLLIILGAVVVLIAAVFVFFKAQVGAVSKTSEDEIRIEVPAGMTTKGVAVLLKENNLIKNSNVFYLTVRFPVLMKIYFPKDSDFRFVLKSGIYYVKNSMNVAEIQRLLSSGQTEYVKVSIPEGLTVSKIGSILESNRICSQADFFASSRKVEILNKYQIPGESCEGYLFPDTYFLNLGMNSDVVVKIMIDNFFEKIKEVPNLAEKNPADLFEVVKLASIVEREYGLKEEAPLIASVFKNRLRRNIGLYSCATLEYIITEIEGRPHPERILLSDTKIDNPYNTYKWAGLPPGPISNPGLVALDASTNTPKTNYYFFQVVDPVTRKQEFTETFDEHKVNHNTYTKKSGY